MFKQKQSWRMMNQRKTRQRFQRFRESFAMIELVLDTLSLECPSWHFDYSPWWADLDYCSILCLMAWFLNFFHQITKHRFSRIDFFVIFLPHVFIQNISTFGHFFTKNTNFSISFNCSKVCKHFLAMPADQWLRALPLFLQTEETPIGERM